MTGSDRAHGPAWHKRLAKRYLLGFLVSLIIFGTMLIPTLPLFIKLLLPFPKLEAAEHWVGHLEIEGEVVVGRRGITLPRNFIVTPEGRMEFKCGYLGRRTICWDYNLLNGATGEVWYHPFFGALQWRFVIGQGKFKGETVSRPISAREDYQRESFQHSRYVWDLVFTLPLLAVALWNYKRMSRHRAAAASGADSSTFNSDTSGS